MSDSFVIDFPEAARTEEAPSWVSPSGGEVRPFAFPVAGTTNGMVPGVPERSPAPPIGGPAPSPAQRRPRAAAAPTPPPGSQSQPPPAPASDEMTSSIALELEARMEAFAEAAVELAAARARVIASMEGQVIDLAVEIAAALVERSLEADPELHGALATAALRTLGDPSTARLRAGRESYAAIVEVFDEPAVRLDDIRVAVELDPSIDGLGCVAENDRAQVDGRVAERLRSVRRAIEDERRRAAVEGAGE